MFYNLEEADVTAGQENRPSYVLTKKKWREHKMRTLPMLRLPGLSVLAVVLALLAACGEEEAGLPGPSLTSAMSSATIPPIPPDWPTYTDPGGSFLLRYPSDWFQRGGSFSSFDPDQLSAHGPPPEGLEIEVSYYAAVGSTGCGGLIVDPDTGVGSAEPGATPVTLGGFPAWQVIRKQGEQQIQEGLTEIRGISLIKDGRCFLITGYYTQQIPDVTTFEQMVSTFAFLPQPP